MYYVQVQDPFLFGRMEDISMLGVKGNEEETNTEIEVVSGDIIQPFVLDMQYSHSVSPDLETEILFSDPAIDDLEERDAPVYYLDSWISNEPEKKMQKFPEEQVVDAKHLIYNLLVYTYNQPSPTNLVVQYNLTDKGVHKEGLI